MFSQKSALILHFFQEVDRPADRTHVRVGEKLYQCCHRDVHGETRTLNVTKCMKYNYKRTLLAFILRHCHSYPLVDFVRHLQHQA
jgi:hypothetical protein